MGRVILKAMLLSFATLALVACSAEPDGPEQRREEAPAPEGDTGQTAQARTMPDEGILPPGGYSVGEKFQPSFSFRISARGWRVLPGPEPYSSRLGYVAPGRQVAAGKALQFLNPREVFEPREEGNKVSFEARSAPEDMVAWLRRHPHLSTDKPVPVEIGGAAGKRLDVRVDVPEGYRGGCAVPCVPLFRSGGDSVTRMTERGKDRFIVLEGVRGEMVIVIISASVVQFDDFLPRAQRVLDTVEWKAA